ncbi:MAG: hypothetical protein BWK72_03380 [Rhodoferax ferrireducens]|uniref:Histidine phosphatase family protein n=1 Tax=Rhodoferax ferrireducens TaxID=192843 RepID=A0A1W9KWR5_9BURK|nr:MAG: hypothetical protein BWK72_03380 [Rhodoferax ferrireducens]
MTTIHARRYRVNRWLASALLAFSALQVSAEDAWQTIRPGSVVLFLHALAPGGGDPPEWRLNDCSTQRNLSAEGQTQAALDFLLSRPDNGVTVVITHQVNITALTGVFPGSGEGVVVDTSGQALKVLGRVTP